MRSSILTVSLALVCSVAASCMSPGLHAQEKGNGPADVSAMARGPAVNSSNGNRYVVLPGARAAKADDTKEESAVALDRMGLSGKVVLDRKGPFVVYREGVSAQAKSAAPAAAKITMQGDTNPVLLNTETGTLAVVTGLLRVKLKSGDAVAVAAKHGLTVEKDFPKLRVAYLAAPGGTDLLATVAALREDSRVAEADLEVIEHVRMAQ